MISALLHDCMMFCVFSRERDGLSLERQRGFQQLVERSWTGCVQLDRTVCYTGCVQLDRTVCYTGAVHLDRTVCYTGCVQLDRTVCNTGCV